MKNRITIAGNPIAKKRPRFARIGTGVRTYSDQKKQTDNFTLQILKAVDYEAPSEKPIGMQIGFFMPRPKSHYGTGKNSGILKKSSPCQHTKKPDIDNLIKFVLDCSNRILWRDDCQVIEITSFKVYSENPRTEITWGDIE